MNKSKQTVVWTRPPVEYVRSNMAVTAKESKLARRRWWAGYELLPTHYDFLPASRRIAYHDDLTRFFRAFADQPEMVLSMVPERIQAGQLQAALAEAMAAAGNEEAADYCGKVAEALQAMDASDEVCRFRFLLWVRLTPNLSPAEMWKAVRGSGPAALLSAATFSPAIREQTMLHWEGVEQALRVRLEGFAQSTGLRFRALEREEVLQRIRAPFWRNIADPPLAPGWAPAANLSIARDRTLLLTPDTAAARRLYSGLVDHQEDWSYVRVTQNVDGQPVSSYQSFLTVEQFSPNALEMPGSEWAFQLQDTGPVELHLRWTARDYRQTLEAIESQQRKHADSASHEAEHAGGETDDTLTSRDETHDMHRYVKATKSPSMLTSMVVVVTGEDPPALRNRVKRVAEVFDSLDTKLAHNGPDQARHFYETIPGAPQLVTDYIHPMVPPALATCMLGTTRDLLDPSGTFFATDLGGRPLWLDVKRALAKLDTAGNMSFVGPMGKGKSATANFILWLAVLFGAKGLAIDSSKPERGEWPEKLPYLGAFTKVVTLSNHDADRGKLDPFTIFHDKSEATNHAISQAAFLTQTKLQEVGYDVLLTAFNMVRDGSGRPSMMAGVKCLETLGQDGEYKYQDAAQRLAERLRNMSRMAWANLLFGDGEGDAIDTSARLTVLQLDRIRRPAEGKAVEDYDMDEYLGHAIMVAATAFANSFARQDRRVQKVILCDEIRWFVATSYGHDLIAQHTLIGRAMGTQVLLIGQNVAHLPADLHQHFTVRWAFGADSEFEAAATLEFLGAPNTPDNRERLTKLNPAAVKGQALVRDLNGRIGEAWVQMLFDDLVEAFRTNNLTEEAQG